MKNRSVIIPMILILFVLTAVPAIIAITVNGSSMRKSSERAVSESMLAKLQANQEFCDELLMQYINEALDFILEKQYIGLNEIISYRELNSDYDNVRLAQDMNTNLKNFVDRNELVHSAFFYIDNADYLVSTDRGIVRLAEYEDIDWMRKIAGQKKTPSGVWVARRMITASGNEKEVLSYFYRSNSLYTASKISVVINVDEEKLSRMIYSEDFLSEGEGYLIDGSGNVLVHSEKEKLYKQLPEVLKKIKQEKKESGIISDENTILAWRQSSLYDWIYVNSFSSDVFFAGSTEIFRLSIVMTLIMILTGVVCAVFLAFRITRPVRLLADKMKEMGHQEGGEVRNEITVLSNALELLKESEQTVKNSMEEKKEFMRRRAIQELMEGDRLQDEEKQAFLEYFLYPHYLVCLLVVDDAVKYQENTTHEERKIFRNMILEYAKDKMPEGYLFDCVRYDVLTIGMLVNLESYDSEKTVHEMLQALNDILRSYYMATGWTMTAGVSRVHNEFKGIRRCAEEAGQAAGRRFLEGKGKVFFPENADSRHMRTMDCYQNQKRMMNYLELGDMEKIREELDTVVRLLKEQGNGIEDNGLLIFNQILGNILVYLGKHHYSANKVLRENKKNMYAALAELETAEEIALYLGDMFSRIIAYQKQEENETETEDYSRRIIKYIKQNYWMDIDFEAMAGEIGISYSYTRKLIRDATGRSLLDYLNLIRVEKAKELMEKGNFSMQEVAEAVGYHNIQSLYRFFKKYEGVSPGAWREGLSEKKEDQNA